MSGERHTATEASGSTLCCIYNARLLDADTDCSGALIIEHGAIRAVLKGNIADRAAAEKAAVAFAETAGNSGSVEKTATLIDAHGLTVQPAFIDMHAHFRYPGQPEKEDLSSALHAAAAGGFGTLVLMPNTVPVVSSAADARRIRAEADAFALADVFQTVSLTAGFGGEDTSHLDGIPSYVPGKTPETEAIPVVTEDGRDVASAAVMLAAMKKCADRGLIVSCHCEDASLAAAAKPYRTDALASYAAAVSPESADESATAAAVRRAETLLTRANDLLTLAEDTATLRNLVLAAAADCRIHIAHVSTARSLAAVREAKRSSQNATCEVTPHHIALSVTRGTDLRHIVNPPIRSESDRLAVIEGIRDGTVDVIATDHAPHTASDKAEGAPGFSGLETAYAVCCTELVHTGSISARKLSELMSAAPARLLGLDRTACPKGLLSPGFAADLVFTDPNAEWHVSGKNFVSKGTYTPLEGRTLKGTVRATYHRGICVFKRNQETRK